MWVFFFVVVGELCRKSLIKKTLPNVLIAFIIMVKFLQIAFIYTSSLIAKIRPLSQGFPAKKDIILFGYRISFAFHILNFSLKQSEHLCKYRLC